MKKILILFTILFLLTALCSCDVINRFIGECEHNYVGNTDKQATCTEDGLVTYTCEKCQHVYSTIIPALGHNEQSKDAKNPNCNEIGWEAYTYCLRCDYTTYKEKSKTSHEFINHEAKEPTCAEAGCKAYTTCKNCDYTTYEEIPTVAHTTVEHISKEPTCNEVGWYAYVTCSECDYTTYKEKDKTPHQLTEHEAKEPTCESTGYAAYVSCKNCSYSTYKAIGKIAHKYSNSVCVWCGMEKGATEGLQYTLSDDSTYYEVSYSFKDAYDIVIPSTYKGLPVKKIKSIDRKITSIIIPEGITEIDKTAFFLCTNLKSINIPDSVTSIGEGAFMDCRNLESVRLPNGLSVMAENLFCYCYSIKSIIIPKTVKTVEEYALYGCDDITHVFYEGSIEEWQDVYIAEKNYPLTNTAVTVCYYSESAPDRSGSFWHYVDGIPTMWPEYVVTKNLQYDMSYDRQHYIVTGIGDFYNDETVIIPAIYNGLPVLEIGSEAFYGCINMKHLIIESGVVQIGSKAFWSCAKLESVFIPDSVRNIGDGAFAYCERLKDVRMSNTLNDISANLFLDCISLTFVKIPVNHDSCTIRYNAFNGCTNLKSVVIGPSIDSIEVNAFYYCEVDTIYYLGIESSWNEVEIYSSGNESLLSAAVYYYSDTDPTQEGNFWHYDSNGEIAVW